MSILNKAVKLFFKNIGFRIERSSSPAFDMEGALKRSSQRNLGINTVIDVGASDGRWAKMCMDYFPDAQYLLIEANEIFKPDLAKFKEQNTAGDYIIAAAGEDEGSLYFNNAGTFGGWASETKSRENFIEVPAISIDKEVERRNLKPPFLIKLDTHGFEVPIIKGSLNTLKKTGLMVIEAYVRRQDIGNLTFYELCSYMESLNMLPVEIADLHLRNRDQSLWEMDIFFIPSDRPEFLHKSYN